MSDYSNSIKKLSEELLKFIDEYNIVNNEPFNNDFFVYIKSNLNKLANICNSYNNTLKKQIKRFNYIFNNILKENNIKSNEINKRLSKNIDEITKTYIQKVKDINLEMENFKVDTKSSIVTLKQDVEFFISSSVQKEEIIQDEYLESINRFDYQISQAKESYNSNISKYNEILHNKLKAHDEEFKLIIKDFEIQHQELIDKYESKISETEASLNELLEQYKIYQTEGKETYRKESISLNESIKTLVEEKNKDIVDAKEGYSKALASSAIEKENKKTLYNQDNQKIQKDFVYNINYLDDILNDIKAQFNKNVEEEQRNLFYNLYEITKKQNAEISKLINNYPDDELPKVVKNALKSKNKQYHRMQMSERNSSKKNIINLEKDYHDNIENAKHNKSLLEIDRIHSLKTLTEKEQSDNKYYQELNGIHENNMNLLIQLANLKFNQKANNLKCKSRINSINNEKNYDIGEANFQKQIEAIRTKIAKQRLDLESAQTLKDMINKYEIEKYIKEKHYHSVYTLLEIEKCKVLNEFNSNKHYHNISNTKTVREYNIKKIQIQNEKFDAETNVNIQISSATLQRNIVHSNYRIKELELLEQLDKAIAARKTNYEIEIGNQNVLYQRFKFEIRSIHQTLSTYVLLNKEIIDFTKKVMIELFKTSNIDMTYINDIKKFLKHFNRIVNEYYFSIINDFINEENDFISKRIEFEEEFKFKSYYDSLNNRHELEINNLSNKKKSISDTIDNYTNTIDTFRNRIYNLESQNLLLNERLGSKLTHEKSELKTKINQNLLDINDYKKKITDITELKETLINDLNNINNQMTKSDNLYEKNLKLLKDMQYNSAMTYHKLKDSLEKYMTNTMPKHTNVIKEDLSDLEIDGIEPFIYNKYKSFKNINDNIIESFYNIVDKFFTSTVSSIDNNNNFSKINYESELNEIYRRFDGLISDNKYDFNKILNVHDSEIRGLQRKLNNTTKRYNNMLKENDKIYKDNVNFILTARKNSEKQFYVDYYATCDNQDAITADYKDFMHNLNKSFDINKLNLIRNTTNMRKELNNNLNDFIKAKDELIERLPVAAKFNTAQLNKETRELNQQIDETIKETKLKYNLEKKGIQKNISNIQNALDDKLSELNDEHQKNIIKEKRKRDAEKQKASSQG